MKRLAHWRFIWLFVFFAVQLPGAEAFAAGGNGIAGIVETDRAPVYSRPDFDADIIATLPIGQKVRISKNVTGKYAKFHKVRVGPKLGYIVETDVSTEVGSDARSIYKRKSGRKSNGSRVRHREAKPIYFAQFIGLLVGTTEFKENVLGLSGSTDLLTYGLKISGPDILFKGPVLDLNLAFHYGAPSYYETLSTVRPTGFVLFSDVLLLLPIFQGDNSTGLLGFGPLAVYSDFHVVNAGRAQDLSNLNFGVSLMAGFAVRYNRVALRLEGKYLWEKQSYKAAQVSLLSEF